MVGENLKDFHSEKGYRIRCMKCLIVQVREDHAELNRLWIKFRKGPGSISEIDELVRVLSWLKVGLDVFEGFKKEDIEGLFWGEIEDINRDVRDKEMELKTILFSVSKETVGSHLR